MRKMINFSPDPNDQGGAGPNNAGSERKERRDPAYSRMRNNNRQDGERQQPEDSREYYQDYDEEEEVKRNRLGWRDMLSARGQERVKTIEKLIAGVITGSRIIKSIKGMSRRQKIAAGALVVVGAAGATYLAMRSRRKRFL